MADASLQHLEHAWRASGSLADEAAYLHARVRAGAVQQSWLDLAAACGSELARPYAANVVDLSSPSLVEWERALEPYGRSVLAAAAVGVGDELLQVWSRTFPGERSVERALQAGVHATWHPSQGALQAAWEAYRRSRSEGPQVDPVQAGEALRRCWVARESVLAAVRAASGRWQAAGLALRHAGEVLGRVRAQVAAEAFLARWALAQ